MPAETLLSAVLTRIERNRDDLLQAVSELIRIPSVVGHEGEAQRYMQSRYAAAGLAVASFETSLADVADHPAYVPVPYAYDARPNVIGSLEGDARSPSLILNGHVDVVSPEPLGKWTRDPWGAEVHDGRLFGRGAFDMKAGLVANLFAVKALLDCGVRPAGSLLLESVIEEEAGGGGGTLACFLKGYRAAGMLVPEPSQLKMVISHNGIKLFRVKVIGRSAHAALSHTGVNAIGKMNRIYDALMDLDRQRAETHRYPLGEKYSGRSCNLNVGTYTAGDWPATVAGMAEMGCRIGFVPGETGADIVREVERTIARAARSDPWLAEHPPQVEWFGFNTEPWLQDENDPFVRRFLTSAEPLLGGEPELTGFPGGLDTRFSGAFGTPSFVFGPKGGNLHGPDEYVDIDSLVLLTRVIAKFILDWCGYRE
jgi:acetylornithine deacetylase